MIKNPVNLSAFQRETPDLSEFLLLLCPSTFSFLWTEDKPGICRNRLFSPCYFNTWILVFRCLALNVWELKSLCTKSSVVASEMPRLVHVTKREGKQKATDKHWAFMITQSSYCFQAFPLYSSFPTQNKVSVCQWDEHGKDKFSSVCN